MSYSISIGGHIEGDADAAKATEGEQIEEAREFVAGLEGVSTATYSGRFSGITDLLAPPEAPETGDDEKPAESGTG